MTKMIKNMNKKSILVIVIMCILGVGVHLKFNSGNKKVSDSYEYFKELSLIKSTQVQQISLIYTVNGEIITNEIKDTNEIQRLLRYINNLKVHEIKGSKNTDIPNNMVCELLIVRKGYYPKGPIFITGNGIYYNDVEYKFSKNIGKDFEEFIKLLK